VNSTGGILVVDDDPDLRDFLQLMLTSMGFEVTSAANGQEALEVMEGRCPDLILLDMKMPVMNGWEFCRALECRDARPPIVVLTAAPDPAARAAEAHADGWLGKPFDYAELEATVRRFAGRPTR
jgi:CheY-like chemotaxis protein